MIKPLSLIIASSHKIRLDWTENLAKEVLKLFTTNGVSHNFRHVLMNLDKSIALIQIQCIVHMKDWINLKNSTQKAKQKKRSRPAYQR